MASGIFRLIGSTTLELELLYDNSSVTSQGAVTLQLPDLTRYNCLAVQIRGAQHNWFYFPYLPETPSNLNYWVVYAYGDGSTNCGSRRFEVNWDNNTLTQTVCRYAKGNNTSYALLNYIYGIVGTRLTI